MARSSSSSRPSTPGSRLTGNPLVDDRSTRYRLGLDLGGTNIKWTVVEGADDHWRVLDRGKVETPAEDGADAVVEELVKVGASAMTEWPGIASAGIGVPGSYDPHNGRTLFLTNVPGAWEGKPVAQLVSTALGVPARLINDARAFGVAELRAGAGRGTNSMIGITLGTGIGGVIALDGRVYHGHEGSAGELGHQVIEPDGPGCSCGGRGCLEALVNAERIAELCGTATVEDAVDRARAGDQRAVAGVATAARYLGIGIANMISVFTPDRVVIGGGISASLDLFLEPVWAEIRQRVHLTPLDQVEIVPAQLGVWAGAIGAAIHGADAAQRRGIAA